MRSEHWVETKDWSTARKPYRSVFTRNDRMCYPKIKATADLSYKTAHLYRFNTSSTAPGRLMAAPGIRSLTWLSLMMPLHTKVTLQSHMLV